MQRLLTSEVLLETKCNDSLKVLGGLVPVDKRFQFVKQINKTELQVAKATNWKSCKRCCVDI